VDGIGDKGRRRTRCQEAIHRIPQNTGGGSSNWNAPPAVYFMNS
jgi:hypothetical protein